MASEKRITRRGFLRRATYLGVGLAMAAPVLAACGPTPTPQVVEKVVKETVVVEKPVTKIVEKEIIKEVKAPAVKRPYKLVYWGHQYQPTDDVLAVVFKEYEQKEPGITIDYFVQRDAEFQEKSMPAIVAGGGPLGMEVMSPEWLIRMDKAGALATVNYEVWGGKEAYEKYLVTAWLLASRKILGRDEDKFVVHGPGLTPGGIYINTKFAQEDGFDWKKYQQESIEYEEVGPKFKVMTKFDDKGNITRDGFLLQHGYGPARIYGYWYGCFYNLGGKLLSDDSKKALLNSPEGYQALQWMYDLVFVHKASKLRPGVKESGSGILPKRETAATPYLGYWAFATFQQLDPQGFEDYRVLMQPKARGKPLKIYDSPGRGEAVNARFPLGEQYEGWKLLKFIWDNGHRVAEIAGTDRFIRSDYPEWKGLKDRRDADVYARNAKALVPYMASSAETLTTAKRNDGFMRAFEDMMFNKMPVKEAIDRWNKEMDEALKEL